MIINQVGGGSGGSDDDRLIAISSGGSGSVIKSMGTNLSTSLFSKTMYSRSYTLSLLESESMYLVSPSDSSKQSYNSGYVNAEKSIVFVSSTSDRSTWTSSDTRVIKYSYSASGDSSGTSLRLCPITYLITNPTEIDSSKFWGFVRDVHVKANMGCNTFYFSTTSERNNFNPNDCHFEFDVINNIIQNVTITGIASATPYIRSSALSLYPYEFTPL